MRFVFVPAFGLGLDLSTVLKRRTVRFSLPSQLSVTWKHRSSKQSIEDQVTHGTLGCSRRIPTSHRRPSQSRPLQIGGVSDVCIGIDRVPEDIGLGWSDYASPNGVSELTLTIAVDQARRWPTGRGLPSCIKTSVRENES